jgi:hypothetical protein
MTDEEAVAKFPGATGFMEVTDPSKPLGAFGVVVDKGGTAWAFDGDKPRPITLDEIKSLGARPCKPSDAVELIPVELAPKASRHDEERKVMKTEAPQKPPELTEQMRPELRKRTEWMTCFQSWKESTSPNEIRDWLEGPKEALLRHLDSLTWRVLSTYLETNQTPDDMAEALKQEIPMEDGEESESPLTQAESRQLREIANEASSQP